MPSKTILITDGDLGFVFWLGQLLDDAGYQALPARSSADAIALQDQFHLKIDLLILNPSLVGMREFTETVCRSQEHMRIMAITDEREESSAALVANALRRKPSVRDTTSKLEWLAAIEEVFAAEKSPPGFARGRHRHATV